MPLQPPPRSPSSSASAREQLAKLPDAEVVALAQQGKESAYRELLARYERPVFSLVFRMVRDRETAEDLAQETFVKVLNNIDRYSPDFKFSSWLFKIANNLTIEVRRSRGRSASLGLNTGPVLCSGTSRTGRMRRSPRS